ncbi:MAG: hemin uptake protein HemP [Lysobacter sp.]
MQLPQPHSDRRLQLKPRAGHILVASTTSEIASDDLLRGTRELLIRHGGEIYRLRHTRNDKLILTK